MQRYCNVAVIISYHYQMSLVLESVYRGVDPLMRHSVMVSWGLVFFEF
jgi:hypothetical protein